MKPDLVAICPACSSSTVNTPTLVGGEYTCTTCGWKGDDPFVMPFLNPHGSAAESFNTFTMEVLKEYSSVAALPVGRLLVKWGFVPTDRTTGKPSVDVLKRYIKSMAAGIITGVIKERQAIEKEQAEARMKRGDVS